MVQIDPVATQWAGSYRYRGTPLRKSHPSPGPYSKIVPRAIEGFYGGGRLLMSEVPLYGGPRSVPRSYKEPRASRDHRRAILEWRGGYSKVMGPFVCPTVRAFAPTATWWLETFLPSTCMLNLDASLPEHKYLARNTCVRRHQHLNKFDCTSGA